VQNSPYFSPDDLSKDYRFPDKLRPCGMIDGPSEEATDEQAPTDPDSGDPAPEIPDTFGEDEDISDEDMEEVFVQGLNYTIQLENNKDDGTYIAPEINKYVLH
jgi:hypothetical protein